MKKICAWCDKILADVPGPADAVTVGICADCDERVREEQGLPLPEEEEITTENTESTENKRIIHRDPDIEHRSVNLFSRSV